MAQTRRPVRGKTERPDALMSQHQAAGPRDSQRTWVPEIRATGKIRMAWGGGVRACLPQVIDICLGLSNRCECSFPRGAFPAALSTYLLTIGHELVKKRAPTKQPTNQLSSQRKKQRSKEQRAAQRTDKENWQGGRQAVRQAGKHQ